MTPPKDPPQPRRQQGQPRAGAQRPQRPQRSQRPEQGVPPRRAAQGSSARPTQRATQRPARPARPARAAQRPARPPRPPRPLRLGHLHPRLRFGFGIIGVALLVIGGRLVQLQGLDHGAYKNAAAEQRVDTITLHALRGQIVDRNGTPLAYTSQAQDITADPQLVPVAERGSYAERLAPLLDRSAADIEQDLGASGHYALLAQAIDPVAAQKVADLNLAGIYSQATTQRQYPGQTTAANIIGTVHSDGTGAAGIEQQFNAVLAGKDGSETYTVDNQGNMNPASETVTDAAQNGATVALTIDQQLQYTAQQLLDDAVKSSGARGAQMAVLDAHTGQVLTLAASGTFDAANPDTINPDEPINPDVMSAFEPGSVQKAITFAAAIQEGKLKPTDMFQVPYRQTFGGVQISDAWWHPTLPFTATGILAESSNVGTLQIAQRLNPKTWFDYEQKFGVGVKTGIELPGESAGYLPPYDTWSGSSYANLPFGQGESMTVLQLASIYQTFANDGVRIPPRIVSSVTAADGTVTATPQPQGVQVVSAQTAKTVRTMLESVVMSGGTGVQAAVPGYRIAGKTGTAQQPDPNNGGKYSNWMNWDTFAGMLPADAPQVVVAIMVDNPAHGKEGGDVAAPLFNQIASYLVQHDHIAPTGSSGTHVPLEDCAVHEVRIASPSTVC